jgi:hypothetical protein
MKANITTNHIRVYKLLSFLPNENLNFICNFLKLNKQNVILYIKQIYSYINDDNSSVLINEIIEKIISSPELIDILKEKQIFTREDRIFYIILKLLRDNKVNLNALSTTLHISRRTLNDDLIAAKKCLAHYNLNISSIPSKGIELTGTMDDIKTCALSYLFKFLIEFDELPLLMTRDYISFFEKNMYKNLNNDIDYFVNTFEFDLFINNKKLIKSLYIVYNYNSHGQKIKNLSLNEFKNYFQEIFIPKHLEKAYNFFKNSSLGDLSIKYIDFLILTLKFCNGSLKKDNFSLKNDLHKIKKTFSNIGFKVSQDNFLEKFLHRINISSNQSLFLSMIDLSFLNLNLNIKIKLECYQIFIELRKIYYNIQFSNVIYIYLWNLNRNNLKETINTIVVFKDLPKFLHPVIKNSFLLKENIKISQFVRYLELDSYLIEKDNYFFITFENLNLETKYSFIKYYSLPL